ncbi:MAG: LPS export ABC transporter periplasmic protein LptC [Spirochaetota bacterium]
MKRFAAIASVIITALIACTDFSGKQRGPQNFERPPELEMQESFRSEYYDGSRKVWEAHASNARLFQERRLTELRHVRIRLFNGSNVSARVEAGMANLHAADNSIELISNVVLISTNGTRLYSHRILWDNRRGKMTSTNIVSIVHRNGDWIRGTGMEADMDLSHVVIKHEVDQGHSYGAIR